MTSKLASFIAAAAALPGAALAAAGPSQYNLQPPQSTIAEQIYDLHTLIMWIIFGIFVLVFGVMAVAIVKHRKAVGHKAEQFHENTTVEIIWTVIPFLILVGMAYPATKTVIAMKDTSNPDITIKATGYQWKWGYDYLQEGISFYSNLGTPRDQIDGHNNEARKNNANYLLEVDNPVVVPVGKKVRIITTANDVIHSWWVPALGIKQDAIPGFVRDTWFKAEKIGVYRGQCAELCGKEHAFMPIVVRVVSDADYSAWVADKQKAMAALADDPSKVWTIDELKTKGEAVYTANCVACHQANGKGVPGAFAPLDGSAVVNGPKAAQIDVLLNGQKTGKYPSEMPAWKQLSDSDIAAVITYTRNNWSNKASENIVQPAEVLAARK
ncbi:MAG: cytochrome c oxidase subunit II [Telluria sp.]